MKNIYFENGVLFYYGNPAGYLHGGTVVLDCVFDRAELVRYIREKEGAKVEFREGVYDRLSEGSFETTAKVHAAEKRLRIYQLGRESPLMMRFVSLAERKKRGYGQPQKSEYILVYEGEAGKFDLEAVWDRFGRHAPSDLAGHALSISDVVEFSDGKASRFFYVEPSGYEEIEF